MTTDQWNWSYKENPEKRLDIILAFQGTDLVGQSASTPLQFSFKKNIVRATRIQNVMVHPDCRGKGIFTATLKTLTEYIYKKNLDLVVTFPNNNSLPTFLRKLDYRHLSDIFTFSLPVSSLTTAVSPAVSVYIDDKIHFSDSDKDFMLSCLAQYDIFNARGLDYLHWRFKGKSGKKYLILRAFRNDRQIALIIFKLYPEAQSVDLVEFFLAEAPTPIPCLLNTILSYYRKNNIAVDSFNIWLFPHYTFYHALIESGFSQSSFSTHVVTKNFSAETQQGFDTCSSYYLSMGDTDVY